MDKELELVKIIANKVKEFGGETYYVGGMVRDYLMGKTIEESKDIDMEIYGINKELLAEILVAIVPIDFVGKQFGIFKTKGADIDIALPRREIKALVQDGIIYIPSTSAEYIDDIKELYPENPIVINDDIIYTHKDFIIISDHTLDVQTATLRRDFTINSVLMNVLTGEIVDIYGGRKDIKLKLIRTVNKNAFIEDPLRVYRAVQFAARFGYAISQSTLCLCKTIDLIGLPKERVYSEFEKMLLKSEKPSLGLRYLRDLDILEKYFPELFLLTTCPQDPAHHPEGDAFEHTCLVLDECAKVKHLSNNPISFMFGGLLHDVGKSVTTKTDDVTGKITSYSHDSEGVEIARTFMHRLTNEKELISDVCLFVEHHMKPILFYNDKDKIKDATFRKLANKVNLKEIALMSRCDQLGRKDVEVVEVTEVVNWFEEKANSLNVFTETIQPIVTGKYLLEKGFKPGKELGAILKAAYDYQLETGSTDKDLILKNVI